MQQHSLTMLYDYVALLLVALHPSNSSRLALLVALHPSNGSRLALLVALHPSNSSRLALPVLHTSNSSTIASNANKYEDTQLSAEHAYSCV